MGSLALPRRLLAMTGLLLGLGFPLSAQAEWGVGSKLPLITYPEVHGAWEVADEAIAEIGFPFHVVGEGVAIILAGKYLFGPIRIIEYGVNVWPFGGAGASLSLFQGQFVYSFHLLAGLEYRPLHSRFRFFAELAVAVYGAPFLYSPAEGVFLGVRYVF